MQDVTCPQKVDIAGENGCYEVEYCSSMAFGTRAQIVFIRRGTYSLVLSPLLELGLASLSSRQRDWRSDFLEFMLEYCLVFPMSLQLLR